MSIIYNLTINELKNKAKKAKIYGYSSKKNKKQLVNHILKNANNQTLRDIARSVSLKGYSKLNKDQLIKKLNPKNDEYIMEAEQSLIKSRRNLKKQYEKYDKFMNELKEKSKRFVLTEKAFHYTLRSYKDSKIGKDKNDFTKYLNNVRKPLKKFLTNQIKNYKSMKVEFMLKVTMKKLIGNNKYKSDEFYFKSRLVKLIAGVSFSDDTTDVIDNFINEIEQTVELGSGWIFQHINDFIISFANYQPLRGGTYRPLPEGLADTRGRNKALINIKNDDNLCFKYCYLAEKKQIKKNTERSSQYVKYFKEVNDKGIEYPMRRCDIPKFEKMNNCRINVYRYDEKTGVYPFYINENPINAINMLLIGDLEKEETGHYVLIRDFNKLNFGYNKNNNKKFVCHTCLHISSSEELYMTHIADCKLTKKNEAAKLELPNESKNILKFLNYKNKMQVPYVIYADFECILKEVEDKNETKTKKTHEHIPCGFGYYVVSIDPNYKSKYISYRGEDAHRKFIESILKTEEDLTTRIKRIVPMELTDKQQKEFDKAEICHVCKGDIGFITKKKKGEYVTEKDKVRDHCHITGKYRGPAHNKCNLNFKNRSQIPVFFHNLKGYDAHLILQVASEYTDKIDCIAQNFEKYVTFSIRNLKFKDSLQFLNSSLDSLVKNLKPEQFNHINKHYEGEQLKLMCKKGIYPYEYMNSFERFNETRLPKRKEFYSSLTLSDIKYEDYEHAKEVWREMKLKNLGDYHDLYLKTDVLLLADVFETFRKLSLQVYELDPAHYFTAPGLSWDAMLLKTKIELELLIDIDMYNMTEKDIRGGISYINHRHAKANNKYMTDYNDKEESSYIIYLDANNLYGHAMSQPLPYKGFTWMVKDVIEKLNKNPQDKTKKLINKYLTEDYKEMGMILEVDLEYPKELHDLHNDYPVAVNRRIVKEKELSKYQKNVMNINNIKLGKVEKLVPTLENKYKYVVHYRNLLKYIELGLKVTKVHRILCFNEKPFLKEYIDYNSSMRAKSKSDFEKDFYKLMNNSVFGKTMENVKNRIDAKIVIGEKNIKKYIKSPLYKGNKIFNENMAMVERYRKRIELCKPIYIGFSVLDLSKLHMYNFHYDFIKPKYNDKAKLLFTDTDSLTYHIKTDDLYKDMVDDKELFDFSDYKTNILKDAKGNETVTIENKDENKKVVGKFKDETMSTPINEFIGLRSKMYALDINGKTKSTAKGINKSVKETKIFQNYKDALFKIDEPQSVTQNSFRVNKHKIYSIKQEKKSLGAFDDKKFIKSDGISTLAFGHYKINKK